MGVCRDVSIQLRGKGVGSDEEGDREEKGKERNWKDTKGRVGGDIKSGGGRAIKGGEKSKRG